MRNDAVVPANHVAPRRLSPELIEARINCRVAELATDAALTSLAYALERLRRDFDSFDRD